MTPGVIPGVFFFLLTDGKLVTGSTKAWLGGFGELANFQTVSDGKTRIAKAITNKGVSATSSDSFATLATKIGQISQTVIEQVGFPTSINTITTSTGSTVTLPSNTVLLCDEVYASGSKSKMCGEYFIKVGTSWYWLRGWYGYGNENTFKITSVNSSAYINSDSTKVHFTDPLTLECLRGDIIYYGVM